MDLQIRQVTSLKRRVLPHPLNPPLLARSLTGSEGVVAS
jgi:hypothetical protein